MVVSGLVGEPSREGGVWLVSVSVYFIFIFPAPVKPAALSLPKIFH